MNNIRNYISILIISLNTAMAVIFTRAEETGSFPDFLNPYEGLFILCYFFSWPITLILIAVVLAIIIKNIRDKAREFSPFLILLPNVGYLLYMYFLLYFNQ